jgi:hypothetical protein
MRTTVDIPDETYRAVRVLAAQRGTTVRQLVLEGLELVRAERKKKRTPFTVPVIRSKHPGTLHLTNEQIEEILAS